MKGYDMEIVYKKIEDLAPYSRNARTHSDDQIQQIADSMSEFGWTNPILLDGENGIIAGHGRLAAAQLLKMKEVPTIELGNLTENQKKAYILADNKLALNAGWDDEVLRMELGALQDDEFELALTGFSDKEIQKLFEEAENEGQGEVKFSEELEITHNYIVLYFDNDMDWLSAQTHFELESVHSKRANGKPWSKGIGRVVNGGQYITKLTTEK